MTKKGEKPLLQCHYYFIITAKHQKNTKGSKKFKRVKKKVKKNTKVSKISKRVKKKVKKAVPNS
jgi:cell fate (sporulation/competence/biofilm development) regulator YmcA (YheA/YmcA/DUF963 family)